MKFEDAIKHCKPHPNGTYDLIPYVDPTKREVCFVRGNSLMLPYDGLKLVEIIGRLFTGVHPEWIRELMLLPNVRVMRDEVTNG